MYIDFQNFLYTLYNFFYLYISLHAYESTSNDTNGFSWKDLPSWKCETYMSYVQQCIKIIKSLYNKQYN
jgi:hypothetical protein